MSLFMTMSNHEAKMLHHCSGGQIQFIFLQGLTVCAYCWWQYLVPPPAHVVEATPTQTPPILAPPQLNSVNASTLPSKSLLTDFALPLLWGLKALQRGIMASCRLSLSLWPTRPGGAWPSPGGPVDTCLLAFHVLCSCISPPAAQAWLGVSSEGNSCEGRLIGCFSDPPGRQ